MTSRLHRLSLVAVAVGLALVTLAMAAERQSFTMTETKTVTVTDKDKNPKAALAPGDLLVVRLEAPLGQTYQWQVTRYNKEQLKQLDRAPVDKLGKSPPSKVELQVFYFEAKAPGACELELEYKLQDNKEAKVDRTYKVKVQVER